MIILKTVLIGVYSYLVGSLNCSVLISRLKMKKDVRDSGSGNAGATNMLRTFGTKWGVITMLGDFFKTLLALIVTYLLFRDREYWQAMVAFSGFCCAMGHVFPIYFGFHGGKAVTVVAMTYFVIDWRCFAVAVSIFILVVILTRYVSLGSIVGGLSGPVTMFFIGRKYAPNQWFVVICLSALALMLVFLHHENINRLINGKERKITFKKSE